MFRNDRTKLVAAAVLLASFLPGVAAQAANLSSVQGKVQLSRAGGTFQAVAGPTIVNPGDVVRAETGSSAQVIYADGSIAPVSSGSSLVVAADPSATLSNTASAGGPAAPKSVPVDPHAAHAVHGGHGLSTTALVVGGAVAAGGGFLLYKTLKKDKDDKPASP